MTSIVIGTNLIEAQFTERVNRFLCTVLLDDELIEVHLHDPGRLKELLLPGSKVLLRKESSLHRKTTYDIVGVYTGTTLVSCDSRVPNRLVKKALQEKALPELQDYHTISSEYTYQNSRIDFCLDTNVLLEVKGVTLVKNGRALFPDAPTVRGRKHVHTLMAALKEGFTSYIFFLIQRPDASRFTLNAQTDPQFATALEHAIRKGVHILAYTSEFTGNFMYLREKLSSIEF